MFADISAWEQTIPSGSSLVSEGDDELRRKWGLIKDGIEEEHYWESATSGGIHKPGSSRISYGNGPAPLSTDEGRLFFDVDNSILILQGSSATTAITTPSVGGAVLQGTGGAQTFASGTSSTVSVPTIKAGSSQWSAGAMEYAVPTDGIYECVAVMRFAASIFDLAGGERVTIAWYKDTGTETEIGGYEAIEDGGLATGMITCGASSAASSNDSIRLTLFQNDGGNRAGTLVSYMIRRVGDAD